MADGPKKEPSTLEKAMRVGLGREMEANPEYRAAVEAARRLHESLHT